MTEDERKDIEALNWAWASANNELLSVTLNSIIDRRIREQVEGRNRGEAHQGGLELHRETFGGIEK